MATGRSTPLIIVMALALGVTAAQAAPPATWEHLVLVKSKQFDAVYIAPGADFRGYRKVMIDPTEIAFEKNWQKEYNRTLRTDKISNAEVEKAIVEGGKAATELFSQGFTKGGYQVVTTPGEDVLRVRTGIVNIQLSAPERFTAGRSRVYANEAGSATLIVEVRDSVSGAILGRAVDARYAGDNMALIRNSVTNRSDFRFMVQDWAKWTMKGVAELKARAPAGPPR